MSQSRRNPVARGLVAVLLALAPTSLDAQQVVSLVSFTNTWRYNDSGADLGTNWRTLAFDDTAWPKGSPLFGVEPTDPFPYASAGFAGITTPLSLTVPGSGSTIITYYFRTRFDLPGASNTLFSLLVTGYVDDGCVFFVNGVEAGRTRVPAGQNFVTPATPPTATEGVADSWVLNVPQLASTGNVLAVEVHQSGTANSDVVFGMKMDAGVAQPLAIVAQPQSQTNIAGMTATFTVGVTGQPVTYQWRKEGINIPGAIFSGLTLGTSGISLQISNSGAYSVVVSNLLGAVTSDNALLTVLPDNQGPRMLDATVLEEPIRTNRILITWNERLFPSTVGPQSFTNFQVIMVPSNLRAPVSNVFYNPGSFSVPPMVALRMSTTNWHIGSNYFVSVSSVRDAIGNVIAPESRIAVSWPRHTEVIRAGHAWSFHSASVFEPDIFDEPWTGTNYVEGPWWGIAPGPFCGGVVTSACFGPFQTEIGFQPEPTLFRTTFVVPASPGFASELRFESLFDDGVVYYLNGAEVYRTNLPAFPTPLTSQTRAIGSSGTCRTNTISVPTLLPGTNWLAAAVFQSSATTEADTAFGLRLRHTHFVPGPLPDVAIPQLNIAGDGTNRYRLWWDGAGYALESTTNLAFTGGAWLEVTNMSNPFTNTLTGERRFFRLRQ